MRIINLSYNTNNRYKEPERWLNRISFFTGILKHLARHGEVIDIHFIDYTGILIKENVTNYFLKYRKWQLWVPIIFHRQVKKHTPDAIIVQGLGFPWQVLLLRLQFGKDVKIILQHHAEKPLRWHKKYLQKVLDKYVHAYLFASAELGKEWINKGLISEAGKIKEVMGASSPFEPIDRNVARAKTRIGGEPVYLWVGRLDFNKDPITLANAFLRFLDTCPEARLYMIYQTNDLLEELNIILNRSPIATEAIHLIGRVDYNDLGYWYNSAEFILSSSFYEGSGVALCEAMSCGCVPIVTNIPSFRAMTENGKYGLLYNPGREEELVTQLLKSLTLDVEFLRTEVLKQFKSKLSFEANARMYYEVISD